MDIPQVTHMGALIILLIGGVVGWFLGLWYARGGKAKVEAELADLQAQAKAQGVILRE